jgi:hypothetical protein
VPCLSLKSDPTLAWAPPRRAPADGLTLVDAAHPERAAVERFVQRVYAERYGAEVRQFAPRLVALHDQGELVAAAGYRPAGAEPLFLERYLPAPVEAMLGGDTAARPARRHIVEVGHLAGVRAGAGRRLILLLGPHLAAQGFHWVVSTLTEELRHLFVRLGVAPLALGVADPAALGADAAGWGRYYDHRPVVLAGQLEQALQRLARRQALA